MIHVENHGPLVIRSNYWVSYYARAGAVFVSVNAGAFRLLLPPAQEKFLADMATAKEVLVSRGPWATRDHRDSIEFLFDDGTENPFALHFGIEQIDRLPLPDNQDGEWLCTVWTAPRRGRPHKALERLAYYRIVPRLPWLRPRETKPG